MSNLLRISEAASLALHTAALLAANRKQVLSTREIAAKLQVSEAHLSKVLQRLAKIGLVESTRGPKGGFRLNGTPEQITLLEVYEAIEGPLAPTSCLLGTPICNGQRCILGPLLVQVNRQVSEYLSGTTLSELTEVHLEAYNEEAARNSQD